MTKPAEKEFKFLCRMRRFLNECGLKNYKFRAKELKTIGRMLRAK